MVFRHRFLAIFVAGVVFASTSVTGDSPAPFRLVVLAAYGEPLGAESLRDQLEHELTERLELDRCFESVVRSTSDRAAEADLIVEVILDRYREYTDHDVTVQTQQRPGEPGSNLQWSAGIEAVVHLQVRRTADRAVVKMKRKNMSVNRHAQPLEDTRFEARAMLLENIVHRVHGYLCGISPQKWKKQIREARLPGDAD